MMHLLLIPFGVVWLYFWVRGHWFAALVAALPVAWLVAIWDHPNPAFAAGWLALPWVPLAVRWMLARREKAPVTASHPSSHPPI